MPGLIAVGGSFALSVVLFGFVVLAGALLVVVGLVLLAGPGQRRRAVETLEAAGLSLSGPLVYVGPAVVQA